MVTTLVDGIVAGEMKTKNGSAFASGCPIQGKVGKKSIDLHLFTFHVDGALVVFSHPMLACTVVTEIDTENRNGSSIADGEAKNTNYCLLLRRSKIWQQMCSERHLDLLANSLPRMVQK